MKGKRKAQPAVGGRAAAGSDGAGCIDSAFKHPHYTTKPPPRQEPVKGGVSFKTVGDFASRCAKRAELACFGTPCRNLCLVPHTSERYPKGESVRADMPQHISNKLDEVVQNVEKRAKGDGTGESENGVFGDACESGSNEAEVQTRCLEKSGADGWASFLAWERASRDTVDFKTIYVDMAGDLVAGLLLSQIVYWYLPSKKDGRSKLRVYKDGHYWIAKARKDWWDEIRISPRQVDRALAILEEKGIIVTALYKFNKTPTKHIRIDKEKFLATWEDALPSPEQAPILPKGENPNDRFYPKGENDFDQRVKSITETTAETTEKETEREISNSKLPSSSFSTENNPDEGIPESPFIDITVEALSAYFGDESVTSNRTQARRLWWNKIELEEEEFVEVMQQAKRITAGVWSKGIIRGRPMAYFFRVLEGELGLRGRK